MQLQQAPGSDRAVCQARFSASCSTFLSSAGALTHSPSLLFYYIVKTPPSFDRTLAPAASMLIPFRGGKAPAHFLSSFRSSSVVSTGSLRQLLTAYIATKTTQRLVAVKRTDKMPETAVFQVGCRRRFHISGSKQSTCTTR